MIHVYKLLVSFVILKSFEECSHSCGYKLNVHLAKISKLAFNVVMNTFIVVMMYKNRVKRYSWIKSSMCSPFYKLGDLY